VRIGRLYGVEPLLGEAATEPEVRRRLEAASIVHLATHGYFHPVLPMSSGILLTVPEEDPEIGETASDGCLQAWEFATELELPAELTVLSACETGRGREVRGEGLVGLTRALQLAGSRSVVATHWRIDDRSTADLMVSFHRKVLAGQAKDEALRQAMAEAHAREATRHPYYWASFLLVGDPDPIDPAMAGGSRRTSLRGTVANAVGVDLRDP
jgi:CHAT domain-containing protein